MPKLSPRLPGGDRNGLDLIAAAAVEHPHRQHVALVILDTKQVTTDADTGSAVATLRIRRVEIVDRDDLPTAERLVRRALERRSGDTVLPIELEDEITIAFKGLDPHTGEILPGGQADKERGDGAADGEGKS
ncbi:hypothetical protein [Nocardia sp. N2S4-5]|uniref:hypothetical protein n=1 Tax=Nocardia sp. N2S4-5 TaxID=3351565 RepID=UPI0037D36FB2